MAEPSADVEELRARIAELEARLAEQEPRSDAQDAAFLRSLLAALPAFVLRIGPDLKIRYINQMAEGFTLDQTLGRSMFDFIAPDTIPAARAATEAVLAGGGVHRFHGPGRGDHGGWSDYETIVAPVAEPDGSRGMILVAFDVSEQAARERALARSEEQLRIALEASGLGLWTWEVSTDKTEWSERMCEIMGSRTPLPPSRYLERVHPEDRAMVGEALQRILDRGEDAWVSHRILHDDGEVRWVIPCGRISRDAQGHPERVLGGHLDVTRVHQLEERLQRAQKLEALGTLTAGVAHNFNNLLAVIRPTLDLLQEHTASAGQPLLAEAISATDRATGVIRQLMSLASTRRPPPSGMADLNEAASSAVRMCQRRFGDEVDLRLEREPGPLPIAGEGSEVEQVIVNLLVNARDALKGAGTPAPTVRVRVRRAEDVSVPSGLAGRAFACAEVIDNGPGIDASSQPKLFDPFFTTKRLGEGTGLGLAISWSVIQNLGGTIEVRSRPGEGTRFLVYLPLRPEVSSSDRLAPVLVAPSPRLRLLLVEDNEPVMRVVSRTLEKAGHEVLIAGTAAGALAVPSDPPVGVVLLDQSLPDQRGTEIVGALRARWPEVKVALFTGEFVTDAERSLVDQVLSKPLSSEDLLAAVRRLGG